MPCPPKETILTCMRTRRAVSLQTNKNIKTIMKKTYIAPEVEEIKVNVANMLAASMGISDTEVDTSEDDVQKGREEKRSAGSLWDQQW